MTLTYHYIDANRNMKNICLQTRHAPESHTAENLKDIFYATFTERKLNEKHIVIDNATRIS